MGEQKVIKFPQRAGLVEHAEGDTSAPYDVVYLKDTDIPLPETINYRTRYAYFKTIARGGCSWQSCNASSTNIAFFLW